MQLVVYAAIMLRTSRSKTALCYCSYLMSVYMYAYENQCEDEFVNCFYLTVNTFLERDNTDCIVLYCITGYACWSNVGLPTSISFAGKLV